MADRKYTDEQRAAMFDLHKRGYKPAEIARICAAGTVSCKPFTIPRRTVHDIVQKMAYERAYTPLKLEDVNGTVLKELPGEVFRIIEQESDRIARKTRRSDADMNRLLKITKIAGEIRSLHRTPGSSPYTNGNGSKESKLEQLAQKMEPR